LLIKLVRVMSLFMISLLEMDLIVYCMGQ
jgi:hypothetical protein